MKNIWGKCAKNLKIIQTQIRRRLCLANNSAPQQQSILDFELLLTRRAHPRTWVRTHTHTHKRKKNSLFVLALDMIGSLLSFPVKCTHHMYDESPKWQTETDNPNAAPLTLSHNMKFWFLEIRYPILLFHRSFVFSECILWTYIYIYFNFQSNNFDNFLLPSRT